MSTLHAPVVNPKMGTWRPTHHVESQELATLVQCMPTEELAKAFNAVHRAMVNMDVSETGADSVLAKVRHMLLSEFEYRHL